MTVNDILSSLTGELWITFDQDPNNSEPNIKISSHSEVMADEMLPQWILDHEVNLMCTPHKGVLYVSVYDTNVLGISPGEETDNA